MVAIQVFHTNNGSFQIKAGTSSSHAADPVLLRLVQFYKAISFCMRLSRSFTALTEIHWKTQNATDAVHELELPQLISANAVNDLESRMQNEIAL